MMNMTGGRTECVPFPAHAAMTFPPAMARKRVRRLSALTVHHARTITGVLLNVRLRYVVTNHASPHHMFHFMPICLYNLKV